MRRGPISNWPPLWMLANVGTIRGEATIQGDRTITQSEQNKRNRLGENVSEVLLHQLLRFSVFFFEP
jgi:hypothetical protein